jgi:hypothetical protein
MMLRRMFGSVLPECALLLLLEYNMFRFLFYPVLALHFSVFGANAAERYGEWLLEQPRSSVVALSFKQSAPLDDKIATSELRFICDQRDNPKNIAVILIPLDGTFENKRGAIPILIQKNSDQFDSSDLSQKWKNGTEYIYSESEADVDELASFLKASETNGVKSVHFFSRMILVPGVKYQATSLLLFQDFPMALARSKTACNGVQ